MSKINTFNLKLLSHSALQLFRSCPRKYELDRLQPDKKEESTIHTAFGSALGAGIQKILETKSLDEGIFTAFKHWDIPLYEENIKSHKSFPYVILGLQTFYDEILPQFEDWELAYIKNGKPACELSFAVELPLEYYYRGFLDAVLRHKKTGKYRVLELKTTGSTFVNEVNYANSFQGVGYSIVLDRIAPEGYSDYEVLYLVYKTYNQTFDDYPFIKLPIHRINWLSDLLLAVEQIELYKRAKRFSQNGDSCKSYGVTCRFFDTCNFSNENLFSGQELIYENTFNPEEFDFVFKFNELLSQQSPKERS